MLIRQTLNLVANRALFAMVCNRFERSIAAAGCRARPVAALDMRGKSLGHYQPSSVANPVLGSVTWAMRLAFHAL